MIKHLDYFSAVPSGISTLRKLIVELAIRGELSNEPIDHGSGYPSSWKLDSASKFLESRSGNSKLIKGKLHSTPLEGTFPGYSASGQDVWLDEWEHEGTAVIVSAVGARCGKAFLAQGRWSAVANTHIIWISKEYFIPEFAMLILNNEDFWIRSGTAQPFVKVRATLEKKIGLPPLVEQQNIVDKVNHLMGICDDVEKSKFITNEFATSAINSSLDLISSAASSEDFHLAWERIHENWNVFTGTKESLAFVRELVLDVLFKPKHDENWKIKHFGEVLKISNGDRSKNYPSKEHRVSSGVPFVNAGHLRNGLIDLSDMDYISQEKYESLSGGKFKDGDVLFCLRGSLGKSALVKEIGPGTVASSLAIFRVTEELDSEYLYWFLQSGLARIQIRQNDNGTAQPNLSAKNVIKFQIPLPGIDEQKAIVAKVYELMSICDLLQEAIMDASVVADRFTKSLLSA